jgi:hypothetical protein
LNNGEEEETFYARAEGETFGKDTAKYGAATSV